MSQSIINLANAMYSQHPLQESSDRLDAAKALLGVSPHSVADVLLHRQPDVSDNSADWKPASRRGRSDSAGLDALALLASSETVNMEPSAVAQWERLSSQLQDCKKPLVASAVSSSSVSSDEEAMPPPPPRRTAKRRRSVSNPEGMDRWAPRDRLRFVLPAAILEEELAEANAAMKAKQEQRDEDYEANIDKSTPVIPLEEEEEEEEEEEDESNLSQEELLRRARSRLLEDLSEVNMSGEKGIMKLPHALEKYKEVYNKDGRVGIYTPAERAAIIARYQGKRSRRVWNKKIRYNCRKNLADRRLRVKGRFVKKEEQAKLAAQTPTIPENDKFVSPESSEVEECDKDTEMPDVTDPDAGFCPTDDQPFRRTRRHTIT